MYLNCVKNITSRILDSDMVNETFFKLEKQLKND